MSLWIEPVKIMMSTKIKSREKYNACEKFLIFNLGLHVVAKYTDCYEYLSAIKTWFIELDIWNKFLECKNKCIVGYVTCHVCS